ncbi:MAG: serine protease [Pirellulaceae bacterium]
MYRTTNSLARTVGQALERLLVTHGVLSLGILVYLAVPGMARDGVPAMMSQMWNPSGGTPHPAIVRVIAPEQGATALGSGSYVDYFGDIGLVLTNWHVVRDATGPVQVVFPGGLRTSAKVLKTDDDWDLAVLAIHKPEIEPLPLAQQAPMPGDILTIAGYGQQGKYRAATGRCTTYVSPGDGSLPFEMVELSAGARQGDSGGPILNDHGELAGVLFGSARGKTSGSYIGRVRWFLDPISIALRGDEDATSSQLAADQSHQNSKPEQEVPPPFMPAPRSAADGPISQVANHPDHQVGVRQQMQLTNTVAASERTVPVAPAEQRRDARGWSDVSAVNGYSRVPPVASSQPRVIDHNQETPYYKPPAIAGRDYRADRVSPYLPPPPGNYGGIAVDAAGAPSAGYSSDRVVTVDDLIGLSTWERAKSVAAAIGVLMVFTQLVQNKKR